MKSKFLATLAALATTSMALAQDDTGNILDDLGGAIGGIGLAGLVIVGLIVWFFFFRGGNSD